MCGIITMLKNNTQQKFVQIYAHFFLLFNTMEYTKEKSFEIQKTKGLHSAVCTNQYICCLCWEN